MNIAYTMAPGRGDIDLLLLTAANALAHQGYQTRGTVQINSENGDHPCDMDVQVLPDGPVVRISQGLGRESKGCRLDPAALEEAVGLVASSLKAGADVLFVNKFGKHEAEGRGFRTVIADAIARDVPVLVGVNSLNFDAFQDFVGPDVMRLEPSVEAITSWLELALHPNLEVA
ncbi:3-dehydroquinate dehydratase [Jannaschia sp. EhC01]|nr:3-dehydroquinate dehydratase [Jannaschia sp. EhC01]